MKRDYKQELITILKKEQWLLKILKEIRTYDLPDWYVGAGAIRNTVWDRLHEYKAQTPLNDIDVIYYDKKEKKTREKDIQEKLSKKFSQYTFEVVNQAFAHKYNEKRPQATSSRNAMSYWPETVTGIGVRLEKDNSLKICAPHGLKDMMTLEVKWHAKTNLKLYQERMKQKQWQKIWPKVTIRLPPTNNFSNDNKNNDQY